MCLISVGMRAINQEYPGSYPVCTLSHRMIEAQPLMPRVFVPVDLCIIRIINIFDTVTPIAIHSFISGGWLESPINPKHAYFCIKHVHMGRTCKLFTGRPSVLLGSVSINFLQISSVSKLVKLLMHYIYFSYGEKSQRVECDSCSNVREK